MNEPKDFFAKRKNGYGENLYRDLKHKKIAGVCAGLAEHFDIDRNIMRLVFIALLFATNAFAFWVYIGMWVLLSPKPDDAESELVYDETDRCYRKKKLFKYKSSVSDRVHLVRERISDIETRLNTMERYVTSSKFELNKKFSDLK